MADRKQNKLWVEPSRREFLQTASALAVGGAVLGVNAQVARAAHSGGTDEIKVALVGCGGRGTGRPARRP